MKIVEAMALSPGNKAQAYNDKGQVVIVQERYAVDHRWWHIWLILRDGDVAEIESRPGSDKMKVFEVDWQADYWSPVK